MSNPALDGVQPRSFNSQHLSRACYVPGPVLGMVTDTEKMVSALRSVIKAFMEGSAKFKGRNSKKGMTDSICGLIIEHSWRQDPLMNGRWFRCRLYRRVNISWKAPTGKLILLCVSEKATCPRRLNYARFCFLLFLRNTVLIVCNASLKAPFMQEPICHSWLQKGKCAIPSTKAQRMPHLPRYSA